MKSSNFKLFSFLINVCLIFGVFYFELPLWTFLLLIPLNFYVQLLAAQQYSFRDSIAIEEIPAQGYDKRLQELNAEERRLNALGFFKFDEFYLQTSNDVVIFAYKHEDLPVTLCHYHHETVKTFDLMTDFDRDFSLTTTNFKHSSVAALRPANKMLQSFSDFPVEMLLNQHVAALRFLESRGFLVKEEPIIDFRYEFMKDFRAAAKRMKALLTPVKVVYLMYFGDKVRFSKSIQEQYLANQLQLP